MLPWLRGRLCLLRRLLQLAPQPEQLLQALHRALPLAAQHLVLLLQLQALLLQALQLLPHLLLVLRLALQRSLAGGTHREGERVSIQHHMVVHSCI